MNRDSRGDVTDVVMAADCWRQPMVGSCGDRFDMTYDGVIDVVDIMQIAGGNPEKFLEDFFLILLVDPDALI